MTEQRVTWGEKKCVFCQQCLSVGERCIATLGIDALTAWTKPFAIPERWEETDHYVKLSFDGDIRSPQRALLSECSPRDPSKDYMKSYIAHEDCFPKGITLQGFRTLGHALEPWFPSPARELVFRPSKGALRDYLGQKFLNPPEEIFQMILWDYAPRSTLARLGVALQFKSDIIKSLDCVPVEQSLQFDFLNPLLRFFALDFLGVRYRPYVSKTAKIGDSSVIRVALDHFGIRSVEILEEYPSTNSSRSQPGTWYILEHLSQARRKFKLFSAGPFIRLKGHPEDDVQMWDIDIPPTLRSYSSIGNFTNRPSRIKTIDMNGLTALTVFYDEEGIMGIYGHHGDDSAITAYENLHETRQQQCTWRYFPLQPGERIVIVWVLRGNSSFNHPILAMKTSLGRNCLFASPWDVQPSTGRTLCDSALKYLHYEELDIAEAISWFGATPKLSKCVVEMPYTVPEGAGYQQRTIASLENVRQVEMYYDEEPACTGLLLTYLDASQESVGQRRVSLSTTKITRIDSPRWICIQEFEIMAFEADGDEWVKRQYVEIQLQKEECKRHTGDEDWHCQPMRGEIQWDFDENHDVVEFLSENPLMVVSSPSP